MTLESYRYSRDPLQILIEREAHQERMARRPRGIIRVDPFGEQWIGKERVMTQDESADIEELLGVWFRWARAYRVVKGDPRVSPSCRNHEASGDEADEVIDARIDAGKAEIVDACMDSLTVIQRAVIGIQQANRHGPAVYQYPRLTKEEQHQTYQAAKLELMPLLYRRGLMSTKT